MKYGILLASLFLLTTKSKRLSDEKYKPKTDEELMNELLGGTVFSDNHNHPKDN